MKRVCGILFALAFLGGGLFAVDDRVIFSIVDSADLGLVAEYNENWDSRTDCVDTEEIAGERFVRLRSDFPEALSVDGFGSADTVYYRGLADGGNVNLIYLREPDEICFFWKRNFGDAINHIPRGNNEGEIRFIPSSLGDETIVQIWERMNGQFVDYFEFEARGQADGRGRNHLSFQAGDGDNTDRIYYEEFAGRNPRRGFFDAPVDSAKQSRFVSLSSDEVVFDLRLQEIPVMVANWVGNFEAALQFS